MIPAEQCISNGFSCIQSAYPTPTDAVRIEAEDRFKGGDRAPYYIMDRRASLKHLKVGEVNLNTRLHEELLIFVEGFQCFVSNSPTMAHNFAQI